MCPQDTDDPSLFPAKANIGISPEPLSEYQQNSNLVHEFLVKKLITSGQGKLKLD